MKFFQLLAIAGTLACSVVPSAAMDFGLDSAEAVTPYLDGVFPDRAPTGGEGTGTWGVENAYPNLTFIDPVRVLTEPNTGSTRTYIVGKNGQIWFFDGADRNTAQKTLFLDRAAVTQTAGDRGMGGMAFHPEWGIPGSPNRGYVYVRYQYTPDRDATRRDTAPAYIRLSRFTVPDGSSVIDSSSELVLINQFDRHAWHNGADMFFGNDGFLYTVVGDEGWANDPSEVTQEIDNRLFSGVLRIDVDRDASKSHPIRRQPQPISGRPAGWPASSTANYFIPNDNPWVDAGGGNLEEFWAIGLRSPHVAWYDDQTEDIWVGDIGQGAREEVTVVRKSDNAQWTFREGNIDGPRARPNPVIGNEVAPVHDYGRTTGRAVIGGRIYRGTRFPDLVGRYIFGDHVTKHIWALDRGPGNTSTVERLTSLTRGGNKVGLSGFGLGPDGTLLILEVNGTDNDGGVIYRLVREGGAVPDPPALLSQTGAFTDLASLTPAAGLVPYTVNQPLYSDGAEKLRWVAVPNGGSYNSASSQVGLPEIGDPSFPIGTVFVKHFDLPVDERNPSITKKVETRFMVNGDDGWYGVTYRWNDAGTDATLLADRDSRDLTVATGASTSRVQRWDFPGRQDCITCHTPASGGVLGFRLHQLNGDFTYPSTGRSDNQLRTLDHLNLFNPPLASSPDNLLRSTNIGDPAAPLAERSRSYLDANCSGCHRPGGVSANFDARFATSLEASNIINGILGRPSGTVDNERVLAPADVPASGIHSRLIITGGEQMPPLGRNEIDTAAADVIAEWINSLDPDDYPDSELLPGIEFAYYETDALDVLPDFATLTPTSTGVSPSPVLSTRLRDTNFAYRFSGFIEIPSNGSYTFYLTSDDGSRLRLGGATVVNNDGLHAAETQQATITLAAGSINAEIEFFERSGEEVLTLEWSGPGFGREVVPNSAYRYETIAQPDPPVVVTITASDSVGGEPGTGDAGATFRFQATPAPASPIEVEFTLSGSATEGGDFTTLPRVVTIDTGGIRNLGVSVIDDTAFESDETVTLTLRDSGGYEPGTPSAATITLTSDDPDPDVAPPSTLPITNGLATWFDVSDPNTITTSGGRVTHWADLSGAELDATPDGSNGPRLLASTFPWGQGEALSFTPADGLAIPTQTLDNYTIFIIDRYSGSNRERVLSTLGTDTNWLLGNWADSYSMFAGDFAGFDPITDDDWHLHVGTGGTAGNEVYYRDRDFAGNSDGGVTPDRLAINGWTAGERSDAEVAELIVFNRRLGDSERVQVENYLYSKWLDPAGGPEPAEDTTRPGLVLDTSRDTVTGNFVVNATFTEPVTGFLQSDLVLTNGSASSFVGDAGNYTFTITPSSPGLVTVRVPGGRAVDAAGNTSLASNTLETTFIETGSGLPVSAGVYTWLDSADTNTLTISGGNITRWADKSGGGNDAVPLVGTGGPTRAASSFPWGSGEALRFTPSQSLTLPPWPNSDYTIFAVERYSGATRGRFITNADLESNWLVGLWGGSEAMFTGGFVGDTPSAGTGWHLHTAGGGNAAGNDFFRRDGGILQTGGGGTRPTQIALNGWSTNERSNAEIAELIIYDRILTTAEQQQVEDYLALRWLDPLGGPDPVEDTTRPTIAMAPSSSIVSGPFGVSVNASEPVTGLSASDFTITNGSAQSLTGNGASYTLQVNPGNEGQVTVSLAANRATDVAGNRNLAAPSVSVTYNTQPIISTPPPVTAGLSVWLDAAATDHIDLVGGRVDRWRDRTTNANHATLLPGAERPQYVQTTTSGGERPAVRFAPGETLQLPPFTDTRYTIFAVERYSGANRGRLITNANFDSNWLFGLWSNSHAMFTGDFVGEAFRADTEWHIHSGTGGTAGAERFFIDGQETTGSPGGNGVPTRIALNGWSLSEQSDAEISELLVYDRILSSSERSDVENFLITKWLGAPSAFAVARPEPVASDKRLIEMALGKTGSDLTITPLDGDRFAVRYSQKTATSGMDVSLHRSTDLISWSPVSEDSKVSSTLSKDGETLTKTFELQATELGTGYFRLKIDL